MKKYNFVKRYVVMTLRGSSKNDNIHFRLKKKKKTPKEENEENNKESEDNKNNEESYFLYAMILHEVF